jgi:hypothetical protein
MKLIKAEDVPLKDDLYKYSNPIKAQQNVYDNFGDNVILYKSSQPNKKYMIYDFNKNKYVHFGSMKPPYEDYLKHNDEDRRFRYLKRALKIKGKWFNNPFSPNSLSTKILWD